MSTHGKKATFLIAGIASAISICAQAQTNGVSVGGSYSQTCWDCHAKAGIYYSCVCQPRQGKPRRSTIEIDICNYPYELFNDDGQLVCKHGRGG